MQSVKPIARKRLAATLSLAALVAAPLLAVSPAHALPIATGSRCNANWVNNAGAMACFTKGEDEANAGAAHPHYVACIGNDIFCCVDDDKGNQDCDAQEATTGKAGSAAWLRAILSAHKTMLMSLGRYSGRAGPPRSEIPVAAQKAAP